MRRILSFAFSVAVVLSSVSIPKWAETAYAAPEIKNVIFLIPDGGGYGHFDLSNMVKAEYGGMNPSIAPNASHWDTPSNLLMKQYLRGSRINNHSLTSTTAVIDSAASGTALATGKKPKNGGVGLDAEGKPAANLAEAAKSVGKSVGIISSTHWAEATPASFTTHGEDRHKAKEKLYYQAINKDLDVVLPIGFGPVESVGGTVADVSNSYTVVTNKDELKAVTPGTKVWGDMGDFMHAEYYLRETFPSLAEQTQAAINIMSADEDGFFLMVESSETDTAGHENNPMLAVSEYLAMEACFEVAVNFAKERTDTVVIVTPDHDTGGLVLGGGTYKEPGNIDYSDLLERLYNVELSQKIVDSRLAYETPNHSLQDIPVVIYAPEGVAMPGNLNEIPGDTPDTRNNYTAEISDIAPWASDLMGVNLDDLTDELFVDVTDYGVYDPGKQEFVFANQTDGIKRIKANESVYYVDDVPTDMVYKTAVFINDKFYVPADMVTAEDYNHIGNKIDGFFGSGTEADPYMIKNIYDFIELSQKVENGTDYVGTYFEQTEDLDLSLYTDEYSGITKTKTFAGTYNGGGHTLNMDISKKSLFPRVTGTIMNLGTTGAIEDDGSVAGIAHTLGNGGTIVNCYSNAAVEGDRTAGIAYAVYGKIINSYFGGTMNGKGYNAIGINQGNASFDGVYYNNEYPQRYYTGIDAWSVENMKAGLATKLDANLASAALLAGVNEDKLCRWHSVDGALPSMYIVVATVEEILVTPANLTLAKGASQTFTATVYGENNPSQEVKWEMSPISTDGSTISADGVLTISETETKSSFTVIAKSKIDGSKVGTATIIISD